LSCGYGDRVDADGLCPHPQGPLVASIYGNGRLTCPIHSYSFDVKTGVCDNLEIGVLKIYAIEISNGRVLGKP
jgi:nitrite reductase (NADH) small subunit